MKLCWHALNTCFLCSIWLLPIVCFNLQPTNLYRVSEWIAEQLRYLHFRRILQKPPPVPRNLSSAAVDIIFRLLDKNPKTRLGCGTEGTEEIKKHAFFKVNLNWLSSSSFAVTERDLFSVTCSSIRVRVMSTQRELRLSFCTCVLARNSKTIIRKSLLAYNA